MKLNPLQGNLLNRAALDHVSHNSIASFEPCPTSAPCRKGHDPGALVLQWNLIGEVSGTRRPPHESQHKARSVHSDGQSGYLDLLQNHEFLEAKREGKTRSKKEALVSPWIPLRNVPSSAKGQKNAA